MAEDLKIYKKIKQKMLSSLFNMIYNSYGCLTGLDVGKMQIAEAGFTGNS